MFLVKMLLPFAFHKGLVGLGRKLKHKTNEWVIVGEVFVGETFQMFS